MLINYSHHLLILLSLIHFSNCNWLRLGIIGIELPEQDYIDQFNPNNPSFQHTNQPLGSTKMHSISDLKHQHRINRKLSNNSLIKHFNYTQEDVFLNHFNHKTDYDLLLNQLNAQQLEFIKQNPNSLKVISRGTNIAIEQCALRFQKERWNCSIEDEKEVFGQQLKRANRESAFLQAIVSAGITYSLTKACSTGNLANCACDYRYERFSDVEVNRNLNSNKRRYSWAGCSDNLAFGIKLAKQFLDSTTQPKRTRIATKNRALSLRESMNSHNGRAGREAIKKLMRLKCRCHGSSGSCQMKTCWKVLPNFDEIGKYLKTKYQHAVHIEGIVNRGANFKLKRSRRSIDDQLTRRLKGSNNAHKSNINQKNGHNAKQLSHRAVILSDQFSGTPEIELQSNSFIVNKLYSSSSSAGEEEIDEDSDYDDEDEDEDEELFENAKKVERSSESQTNKFISKPKQANDKRISSAIQLDANKIGKSDDSVNANLGKVLDNREMKANNRSMYKLKTNKSNIRTKASKQDAINQQMNNDGVVSKQFNEIDLQFTNFISDNKFKGVDRFIDDGQSMSGHRSVVAKSVDEKMMRRQDFKTKNQVQNINFDNFSDQRSPDKHDLVYINKSPNYCSANDNLLILGTMNRTCRKTNKRKYSDSCEALCCGRGYDRRIVRRIENCDCEFDVNTVQVKCKTCEQINEIYTCK